MTDSPAATTDEHNPPALDSTIPQTARIWNYLLGGKDNYASDRAVGDEIIRSMPELAANARSSRAYLARAVRWLAAEAGIRQFLDIGTGLPTAENTHEVAQAAAPDSRIVYVDNDKLVLVHARALLTSSPQGVTTYVDGNLRNTDFVLAEAAKTLDFNKPVGLLLMGILGHIESDDEAKSIIDRLMAALPSGSYLAQYDGSDTGEAVIEAARIWNISANPKYHLRSPARMARFYEGLEMVEPGLVTVTRWKPESHGGALPEVIDQYGGVGRKP